MRPILEVGSLSNSTLFSWQVRMSRFKVPFNCMDGYVRIYSNRRDLKCYKIVGTKIVADFRSMPKIYFKTLLGKTYANNKNPTQLNSTHFGKHFEHRLCYPGNGTF